MVTVLVLFPPPADLSREQLVAHFRKTATHWSEHPQLLHKSYLHDAAGRQGGATFLWPDRAAAERAHDGAWRAQMVEYYGSEPAVQFFETPLAVFGTDTRGVIEAAA